MQAKILEGVVAATNTWRHTHKIPAYKKRDDFLKKKEKKTTFLRCIFHVFSIIFNVGLLRGM